MWVKAYISEEWTMECLQDIGFTEQCSKIWYWDSQNTRKGCEEVCLKDWILHVKCSGYALCIFDRSRTHATGKAHANSQDCISDDSRLVINLPRQSNCMS